MNVVIKKHFNIFKICLFYQIIKIIFSFIGKKYISTYTYTYNYELEISLIVILFISFHFILNIFKDERKWEYITSVFLNMILLTSVFQILFLQNNDFYFQLYVYLISLCFYHFMEYFFVCVYHFEYLTFESKHYYIISN
jgi:hypothetical protein